ncbi:hypothetical protein [Psychrobacter sp. PAMC 21119]|uniref:hypothetical protein n=1 Tax=Psychrobacter sp. PAMC 21119 TaxID=1112209 RepID=UPI00028A0D9C|nr:hypothetical protein [Psychrobacter sp. PAMC 21119]
MNISDRTILDYDASGFIVGIDRMSKGIDNVSDNTDEIIQILKAQRQVSDTRMIELARAVRAIEHQISINNNRKRSSESGGTRRVLPPSNDTSSNDRISNSAPIHRQRASDRSSSAGSNAEADNRAINRRSRITSDIGSEQPPQSDTDSTQGRRNSAANRQRDANGRFTGGSTITEGSTSSRSGFGRGIGSTNTSGVDPLIDSFNEAKDLLSPLTRGAGMIGRGAKLSISKLRSLKRREPLPADQSRHNNENEKLLDKIWKAVLRSDRGGGSGGGLLGGLLGGGRNRRRGGRGGVGGGLKKLLKKVGGFKGLSVLAGLAGSAALAMDWDNLDHKGKSAGVGGLAGMGVGGLIGGTLGAVGGPMGIAAGAAIGGWLGSEGGEWLGTVASPHIDSWTQSMIRYNLPDKMSSVWDEGIKPFFATMISAASNFYEASLSKVSAAIDNVGNFIEGGVDGITSANAGANGASPAQLTKQQNQRQMMVYDSFRNAGLSDAQSRAMTAEVGRENGYQDKYLFGGHSDPANNEYNLGMFSWQKDRGKKLYKHLNGKGLIKNGKIIESQEALNEQAKFAVNEMQTTKDYSRTKREFLENPNVSYGKATEVLGRNYIRWRHDDPKYAKHHQYRDQYKAALDKQLKPIEDTNIIDEAKDKAHKAGTAVREAVKSSASNAKGYTGSLMGPETNKLIRDNIQPTIPASNDDALVFKSALGVAAGGSSRGYTPPSLPTKPMLEIPKMPRISQRLDSGSDNKPMFIQSSNDTISQNVSDRGLAHAITGGIGKDRYYG